MFIRYTCSRCTWRLLRDVGSHWVNFGLVACKEDFRKLQDQESTFKPKSPRFLAWGFGALGHLHLVLQGILYPACWIGF